MTKKELLEKYKKGERDFRKITLSGAYLSGTNLSKANLYGANLSGADLSGADLSEANLSNITLCRACIDGAILDLKDISGPGHILYALTEKESLLIENNRRKNNV